MRIITPSDRIFDTQIDTNKIFVPMKHKFHPHNHINAEGKSLLYLHVWEKFPVTKRPLDVYVPKKYWDSKKRRLTKACPEHENLNLVLDKIESEITELKIQYKLSDRVLTVPKFLQEFRSGGTRLDFVEYFRIARTLEAEENKIHKNTAKKEKSVHKALSEFMPKIPFPDLDLKLLNKFIAARKSQKMKSTTIASNVAIIKKYIGRAIDDGIKMPITLKQIKVGSTDGNRESLSETELRKYLSYYRSEHLRDNHKIPLCKFLFSCFTGIRIGDNQNLTIEDFYDGSIAFEAEKTGKRNRILLNKMAMSIISHCPEVFVTDITDQHVNRMLQDAAKFIGIKTHVTFHISRHTFATELSTLDVPVQVISNLLDHANIQTTMVYMHTKEEQKNKAVMKLDEKYSI